MKSVKRICAFLIGFVFFISGLLKLMDPVGAGLVMGEYYNFLHLGFLAPTAKAAGVFFALLETFIGAALLTGVWPRVVSIVSGIMLAVFTLLTFVLWIMNPQMDCGCFGEAVHLTHSQSFIKNLILCALWIVAFIPLKAVWEVRKVKYVSFAIAVISSLAFCVYSLLSIPAMDFTPFKPGATLMQAQASPSEDAPLLSFCSPDGYYCDELLAEGSFLIFSAYDPDRLDDAESALLVEFGKSVSDSGAAQPVYLAAGDFPGFDGFFRADRRSLMTLNRSNGGATLIRDGLVIAKWPLRSLPDVDELQSLMSQDAPSAVEQENTPRRLKLQGFLLYLFAVVLLL